MPSTLVSCAEIDVLKLPHFPDRFLGAIWRAWGQITPETLAKVLETTPENIKKSAEDMGLDPNVKADEALWKKRGYITLIRNMWHLLTFDQICDVLGVTGEELDTTLKEDDFLYIKMGSFFPKMTKTVWRELTDSEQQEVAFIKENYSSYAKLIEEYPDDAFRFVKDYYKPVEGEPKYVSDINGDLRIIYSYFALFGDPLMEDDCDPFPDKLLEDYAQYGINGIWMQGVLYQLVPYPFAPELSEGWEKRIANLAKIVKKAAKYGIGIYLYINEPRMMPSRVFEKYPNLKGHQRPNQKDMYSMCTSTPEVQKYLDEAMYELFKRAEGLAGFITITASENQTNCYSHSREDNCNCPRCKNRKSYEVLSEVNNIMSRGARRANPNARGVVWSWSWPDNYIDEIIKRLDKDIVFQCVSETRMPLEKGGIKNEIHDYSMSNPGPSHIAKRQWKTARDCGIQCSAKVQFNCSWELPGVPYVPAYSLVAEHAANLNREGVQHVMLSWTLGGSPSPNIAIASEILLKEKLDGNEVRDFVERMYPGEMSEVVFKAQDIFSKAFNQFPFNISVLYTAPQTSGPKSPFFVEKTGLSATMTCFPYDAVDNWRANYPIDVFEQQFTIVTDGWREALDTMESYKGEKNDAFCELYDMMLGSYVHYMTNLNLIKFNRRRNECFERGFEAADYRYLLDVLEQEEKNVVETVKLQSRESRLGFEAANHYCFTRQDLTEKLLNIAWCKRYYENEMNK